MTPLATATPEAIQIVAAFFMDERKQSRPRRDVKPPNGLVDEAKVRRALTVIPADDHAVWISVGMALEATFPDHVARAMWDEWSRKSDKFDQADSDKRWRSFRDRPGGKTVATIFDLANKHDPGWFQAWRREQPSTRSRREPPMASRSDEAVAAQDNRDARKPVLIPGGHASEDIGNDTFVQNVLAALPPGALYRRGGIIGELQRDASELKFVVVGEQRMRAIVDTHVCLQQEQLGDKQEVQMRFKACSRDLAAVVLGSAPSYQGLRELRAIVTFPAINDRGQIVEPGWNACGIYYDEPSELVGLQPRIEDPLSPLFDLLTDFPFEDNSSRQNAIGMMLTAICRYAIAGNVPFHLVFASLERTGKGLLIDTTLGIVVLGRDAATTMQLGRTEDEREKRITSSLLAGMSILHFDNLSPEDVIDSPSLASLATARIWSGRVLGRSAVASIENMLIVAMSGNNPKVTGELTKRTVPIRLQPRDDRPENRSDFVHSDIRGYARSQRRLLIECLLGIFIKWRDADSPMPANQIRMGGFEEWARIVGGAMHHAGATEWMSNYSAWVRCGDEFAADAKVLVDAWRARHGSDALTATNILGLVRELRIFPQVFVGKENGHVVRLSKAVLTPLTNRPVGRLIVKRHGSGNTSYYSLQEAS